MSAAEEFLAPDGRRIGLVVRADFDDFAAYPPTFETAEEREWLARHYRVASPELERTTKAHLTSDELPLQLTVLARPAGAYVRPHYHINDVAPQSETRHQVMICLGGRASIGIFTREGEHVAHVTLGSGDLVLLYEGHSVETLEDGTRLLEIKQGPMPADPYADNVAIESTGALQ
ncbi:hypothetical protein [Embleya sp. NPDC001921]